jgi:hypothetical protein
MLAGGGKQGWGAGVVIKSKDLKQYIYSSFVLFITYIMTFAITDLKAKATFTCAISYESLLVHTPPMLVTGQPLCGRKP